MEGGAAIERALRRDQRLTAGSLAALCALAWAYLVAGAGLDMSFAEMAAVAFFPHAEPAGTGGTAMLAPWSVAYAALIVLMWWVMMIAMMIPSAAPMILLHARVAHHARAQGKDTEGALSQTGIFLGGYLAVWLAFSVAAAGLQWALEATGLVSAMMMSSLSAGLSAAVLIAAGLYQWSPLKKACLRHCRSPARFLSRHWRPGALGAARLGIVHGAYCLGCCWALMALLFVGGVMNPVWIAALAIIVLTEKLTGPGLLVSTATGALLITWGLATLWV